jgi:hypothetical protein
MLTLKSALVVFISDQNRSGSTVVIATAYWLDGPGFEFRCGRDFPHLSIMALGPTQPPVQWVPGLSREISCGRGVTLTPHPLLVPRSKQRRAISLLSLRAFVKSETSLIFEFH